MLADGDTDAEGLGLEEGVLPSAAEQPTSPIMTMALALATRLTLDTAAPHSADLHPAST
ncbi:MAG: hypothetical protein HOY71_39225 [Nonomuraea sp.]|nr:hypothetical protein [Nonomuraea sp.]